MPIEPDPERIEPWSAHRFEPAFRQQLRQQGGLVVNTPRLRLEPFWAVIHGVHGRHNGQEDLGGADVAGGLIPADVLLPGLKGQPKGGIAVGILGDAR